jgi:2-methylcitrate dehydratase PrpD
MRAAAKSYFGEGSSRLWFTGESAHKAAALLGNCAAASALDIDDGHRGASGHPGAAIIPAVLAEAQETGADGHKILAAVAIGYDVALRIASARLPGTVKTYSSGRWTGHGVAAAIGWMRGLSATQLAHAITIAGAESPENLPAGSYRRLSSVKGSSPWSTLTAMIAVARAEAGSDGPDDSLDRGDVYDPAAIVTDLGHRWLIEETYLKPYASCRYTHPSMDAIFEISSRVRLTPDNIQGLSVDVFPEAFTIANERAPRTLEGAQFSIPYCLALAALRGPEAFRPMTEAMLDDQAVVGLSQRVTMATGEDFLGAFPTTTPSRVRIEVDGKLHGETVWHPLGDVHNPLDRDQVRAKLVNLARGVVSVEQALAIFRSCEKLLASDTALFSVL